MNSALQKITTRAKAIRKKTGCDWKAAVKKASLEYRKGAKTAKKKRKVSGTPYVNGIRKNKRVGVKTAKKKRKVSGTPYVNGIRKNKRVDAMKQTIQANSSSARRLRDMTETALFQAKRDLLEVRASSEKDKRWDKKMRIRHLNAKIKMYKELIRKLNSSLIS